MFTRVMFCGDVHLGRRPAGLPNQLEGLAPSELGSRAALIRAVAEACREKVDAFVFAGDVVERENSVFEAFGALSRSIEPLRRAGIAVFAVAGNHDVETLPRLAQSFPESFRLLGAGGRWEDVVLESKTGPRIALRGWSFPTQYVRESPFTLARPEALAGIECTLGVLHGDLDDASSRYAPLRMRDLDAETPVKGWFLGHIHKPSLDVRAPRPIGYLGSLTALDRTETGTHGPWIVEVGRTGSLRIRQCTLAPLAFENVVLDASLWSDGEAFESALRAKYQSTREAFAAANNTALAVGFNVTLQGAPAALPAIRRKLAEFEELSLLSTRFEELHCFVARLDDRMHEPVDLAERARSNDPGGLLAQRLQALQEDAAPHADPLLARAREVLDARAMRSDFAGRLDVPHWSDAELRERLVRAGWRALEHLEATRAGIPG